MPRAVIQGEVHTSRRDKTALKDRVETVDAILRESMEQGLADWRNPFYLLLFAGMKLYRNTVQRLLYASDIPVFALAEEKGVATHRMNTSMTRWNDSVSWGKKSFILGIAGIAAYAMVLDIVHVWLRTGLFALFFIIFYFLYAALLTIPERDRLMADTVIETAEREGYDTVLVSVGDAHVEGIADLLQDRGWDVERHASNTLFGWILRPVLELLKRGSA